MKALTVKEYRTIQKMGPGPDLDIAVATKFFGWRELSDDQWEIVKTAIFYCNGPSAFLTADMMPRLMLMPYEYKHGAAKLDWLLQPLPAYSTNDERAKLVVDELKKEGWQITTFQEAERASVTFQKSGSARVGRGDASTYAWAVSMAALSTLVENWADGTDTPEWHPAEGGE